MTHTFVHACAGSGKTQSIIARCQMDSAGTRRLIITLTTSGQDEIESRLRQVSATRDEHPEVSGWYAFLLNQIVRPYLELLFPGRRIAGFLFARYDSLQEEVGSGTLFFVDWHGL